MITTTASGQVQPVITQKQLRDISIIEDLLQVALLKLCVAVAKGARTELLGDDHDLVFQLPKTPCERFIVQFTPVVDDHSSSG